MKKTLKEIKNLISSQEHPLPLFLYTTQTYPEISDSTANFLTDYAAMEDSINAIMVRKRASQVSDFEADNDEDLLTEWVSIIEGITNLYLDSWARLYYALSLSYNPIWNVDGTTVTERDAIENSTEYGEQELTVGTKTDTTTDYSVSYDSSTEKETGKSTFTPGEQTNTSGEHTDTFNLGAQKETVTRSGNQGVTMTQQMLESEWKFRQKCFFEEIINHVLDDVGFRYEGGVPLWP